VLVVLYDGLGNALDSTTTDNTGHYMFNNLPAGEYQVGFYNIPSGTTFTNANQGSDVTDSDAGVGGLSGVINLSAGEVDTTVDAGIVPLLGALGNYVWNDTDRDGQQDAGESGVEGVLVVLYDGLGNALDSTTTDNTGHYMFNNLPAGEYQVGFYNIPSGTTFTSANQGSDVTDSDAGVGGLSGVINLSAGEVDTTVDAGIVPLLGALGNYVWNDTDRDGQQDAGETGVEGVLVVLYDGLGNALDSTTTDNTGHYMFNNLPAGEYQVGFYNIPSGTTFTNANQGSDVTDSDAGVGGLSGVINLSAGEVDTTVDAGIVPLLGALGNYVWNDTDRDGQQDAGESGVEGVLVVLYDGLGNALDSTTTDNTGHYMFNNLPAGEYQVGFYNIPSGTTFTNANQGSDVTDSDAGVGGLSGVINLSAGEVDTTVDAGIVPLLGALGNYVWNDTDRDGQQDAGETGVEGVLVVLYDGLGNALDSTTTDNTGHYMFNNLPAGEYQVGFYNIPSGTTFTNANQGSDVTDSDAGVGGLSGVINLSAGEVDTTVDAGIVPLLGALGNYVWNDTDRDGQQDAGESGVEGVLVVLYDGLGNALDSTTTDNTGHYMFNNLPAGEYQVGFYNIPSGTTFTNANQGSDVTDSDAGVGGLSGVINLSAGEVDTTIDAGIHSTDCGFEDITVPCEYTIDGVNYADVCLPIDFQDFFDYTVFIDGDEYMDIPTICGIDTVGNYDFSNAISTGAFDTSSTSRHILISWKIGNNKIVPNPTFFFSTLNDLATYMNSVDATGNWIVNNDKIEGGDNSKSYDSLLVISRGLSILQYNKYIFGGSKIRVSEGCHEVVFTKNDGSCIDTIEICVICPCDTVYSVTQDITVCAGACYEVGTSTHCATGIYVDTIKTSLGCDSIITTNLTVRPAITTTISRTICTGESVTVCGTSYNTTGTHVTTCTSSTGCDSVVTLNLTVRPAITTTISRTICTGESVTVCGTSYNTTGTHVTTCTSSTGCDSVVTLNLTVRPAITTTISRTICTGESVTVCGTSYNTTGTHVTTCTSSTGCDSVVTLNLTVRPAITTTISRTICTGESVTVCGTSYNTTGTHVTTCTSSTGCDSVVTLNLTVRPAITTTISRTICTGESVTVCGTSYNTTGTHVTTCASSTGCDSVVTLNLTVRPAITTTISRTICTGESVTVCGTSYNTTGTHVTTCASSTGCDSVVTLNLTVRPAITTTISRTICSGESVTVCGTSYNTTGTHVTTCTSSTGCDSVVTLNLTVRPAITTTISRTICSGESVTVCGTSYNTTGTHVTTCMSSTGCDSVVTLNLTVRPAITTTISRTICSGESVTVCGTSYNTTGTHVTTCTSSTGCDSVVTLNLTVRSVIAVTQDVTICAGTCYEIGSSRYCVSGTYRDTLTSSTGCDSIVRTRLVVSPQIGTADTTDVVLCGGGCYTLGGVSYCTSGVYVDTIESSTGCDSVVIIRLTIGSDIISDTLVTLPCELDEETGERYGDYCMPLAYTDISGYDLLIDGEVYFDLPFICDLDTSGGYDFSTAIRQGAYVDNQAHILLSWEVNGVVRNIGRNYVTLTELERYIDSVDTGVWNRDGDRVEGGLRTVQYGPLRVFSPVLGTLSIIDYNLNIFSKGTLIRVPEGCHTITLIDKETGCRDNVKVCVECPCDTVYSVTQDITVCAGACYEVGTSNHCATGIYVDTIKTSLGCDSIITTNLTVRPAITTTISRTICTGESVTVCGTSYNTTGTHVTTCTSSTGCDSVVTLNLTVRPVIAVTQDVTICAGTCYEIGSSRYCVSGTYRDTLTSVTGCDSIVRTRLTVSPLLGGTDTTEVVLCGGGCYTFGGNSYCREGVYVDTIESSTGCDSVVIFKLTIVGDIISDTLVTLPCELDAETGERYGDYCMPLAYTEFSGYDLLIDGEVYFDLPFICDLDTSGGYDFSTAITQGAYVDNQAHVLTRWEAGDTIYRPNLSYRTLTELEAYMNSVDRQGRWDRISDRVEGGVIGVDYGKLFVFSPEKGTLSEIDYNLNIFSKGTLLRVPEGCHKLTIINKETGCRDSVVVCVECPMPPDTIVDTLCQVDCTGEWCKDDLTGGDTTGVTVTYCDGSTGTQGGNVGTWSIDANGCLHYVPNGTGGVGSDTACIVVCKGAVCDTTIIVVVVPPSRDTLYDTIPVNVTDSVCVELESGMGGTDVSYSTCSGATSGVGNHGNYEVTSEGCVRYTGTTPGTDTICVVACDGSVGMCDTTIVIITIPEPNRPDTIVDTLCQVDCTGEWCKDDLTGGDTTGVTVTYCDGSTGTQGGNVGTWSIDANGCLHYVPNGTGGVGSDTACIVVCKGAVCDTTIIVVVVPPSRDTLYDTIPVNVTDSVCVELEPGMGGTDVTYSTCSGATSGVGNHGNYEVTSEGCVRYTGTTPGNDTICVVACDASVGMCDTTIVIITVPEPNRPDTIVDTLCQVDCTGEWCKDDLTGGDTTGVTVSYCDGSTGTQGGNVGTWSIDANGCLHYVPNGTGGVGSDTACIVVCKGAVCDTTIIVVVVPPSRDTLYDTIPVNVTDSVCVELEPGMGGTDVTYSTCSGATSGVGNHGNYEVTSEGCVRYTGTTPGTDTICVVACDGSVGMCDTTIVIITVPEPLFAVDDYDTTSRNVPKEIAVLINDNLPEGVDTIVSIVSGPTHGLAVVSDSNTINYIPETNYCGEDTLSYEVCVISTLGVRSCDIAEVYIHVACMVEANPDVDTVEQGGSVVVEIYDNDTVDYELQGPEIVSGPRHGTAVLGGEGVKDTLMLSYTHTDISFCGGYDTLIYRICARDGGLCDTTTVAIYVVCGNPFHL
jgi:hypothetical protein